MQYQDAFIRYTTSLDRKRQDELQRAADAAKESDRLADARSSRETNQIKRATVAMAFFAAASLLVTLFQWCLHWH